MTELETLRDDILTAALPHVPFDGWSMATLRQGAKDAGFDTTALLRAFPDGVPDAIEHFIAMADRTMLEALEAEDLESMRVRDRVARAIQLRLTQAEPHKEAIRRAGSFLAMPQNAALSLRTLNRTVDAIWTACGDTSTDINYYTKRALLAGVYGATLLYWLDDRSEGHVETWAFLDRRIDNVMSIGKATGRFKKAAERVPFPDPLAFARKVRDRVDRRRRQDDMMAGTPDDDPASAFEPETVDPTAATRH